MGALSAMDMAEQVDIRTALAWHLQYNHYPPIPVSMVDTCIAAIDACNDGVWNEDIDLPAGVYYKGRDTAPAWAIAEQHHLDPWITEED